MAGSVSLDAVCIRCGATLQVHRYAGQTSDRRPLYDCPHGVARVSLAHFGPPAASPVGECRATPVGGCVAAPAVESCANAGHPAYLALLDELRELHIKKAADYGSKGDFLANVRSSVKFGVPAWVGVMIRAHDKMIRVQSFCEKGKLENESLRDAFLDLAAYAMIAAVLYDESVAEQAKREDVGATLEWLGGSISVGDVAPPPGL